MQSDGTVPVVGAEAAATATEPTPVQPAAPVAEPAGSPAAIVETVPGTGPDGDTDRSATRHVINAQARVFAPEIIYIRPGDTVQWVNMTSHNSVSVDGLIPDGATGWRSGLGENLSVTLTVEGLYPYVCEPHIGFGMVGVIVVGEPGDVAAVNAKAAELLQGPYRRLIGKLRKIKPQ